MESVGIPMLVINPYLARYSPEHCIRPQQAACSSNCHPVARCIHRHGNGTGTGSCRTDMYSLHRYMYSTTDCTRVLEKYE